MVYCMTHCTCKGQWSIVQLWFLVIRQLHNPHLMEAPGDHILAMLFVQLL